MSTSQSSFIEEGHLFVVKDGTATDGSQAFKVLFGPLPPGQMVPVHKHYEFVGPVIEQRDPERMTATELGQFMATLTRSGVRLHEVAL